MHPRRGGARQRNPKPWLHQPRLGWICKDRREIILPQRQEAAGKICSIAHRTQYRLQPCGKKRRVSGRRVFDEAILPKHCIVVAADPLRAETSSR
jgi:hypothetical protein